MDAGQADPEASTSKRRFTTQRGQWIRIKQNKS
jgi:hypothetical protein